MSPPEIKAPVITIFFLQESLNYYNLFFSSFSPHLYSSWSTHLASIPPHVQDSPTVPAVCFTYAPQQDLLSSVVILFRGTCRSPCPSVHLGELVYPIELTNFLWFHLLFLPRSCCPTGSTFSSHNISEWIHFCRISPSKPGAWSLGSVCHTTLHKRLDLCSSWCSKCAVIARSHVLSGCVQSVAPNLFICGPCDNDALPSRHHTASHFLSFCALIKVIVIEPRSLPAWRCLASAVVDWRKCLLCRDLIGPSVVIATVMARAGRCYRSRFGGAILLTRSLLRQAASSTAVKCVISSEACWWQTVGDLCITFLCLIVIEYDAGGKLESSRWENTRKLRSRC